MMRLLLLLILMVAAACCTVCTVQCTPISPEEPHSDVGERRMLCEDTPDDLQDCDPPAEILQGDLNKYNNGRKRTCTPLNITDGVASCPYDTPTLFYMREGIASPGLSMKWSPDGIWSATDFFEKTVHETTNACCISLSQQKPKGCAPPAEISQRDLNERFPGMGRACTPLNIWNGTIYCPDDAPVLLYKRKDKVRAARSMKCSYGGIWRVSDFCKKTLYDTTNACCINLSLTVQ